MHSFIISKEKILNLNDIRQIKSEIKEFMTKIDDYDNEKSKKEYESKVLALLEEYKKVASNSSKGLVIFKKKVEEDSREKINYRLKIIRDYIEAAKDYIKSFFMDTFYNPTDKSLKIGISDFIYDIFDIDKSFSKSDLESFSP
jgi:hypothetical protein